MELEKVGMRRRSFFNRKVLLKFLNLIGDVLFDEVLKYIKEIDLVEIV